MNKCACGQPIISGRSDTERCADCARERANMLARRRKMAKRVSPEHLEGALVLQEAGRQALQQRQEWLKATYEAHEARRLNAAG